MLIGLLGLAWAPASPAAAAGCVTTAQQSPGGLKTVTVCPGRAAAQPSPAPSRSTAAALRTTGAGLTVSANAGLCGSGSIAGGPFTPCGGPPAAAPAGARPAPASLPSPAVLATAFWRDTPLPVPKPSLNPANPITGLDAFLSIGADLRPGFSHDTPLGPLSIAAVGTPTIRWGDGAVTTGPPGYTGGPYPTGKLIHQYIDRCVGALEVNVAWTATWRLAGDSGSLAGMTTNASVVLRTEEIQAVLIPVDGEAPDPGPAPPPPACPSRPGP